jgi:Amt family ammonium transporter
MSLESISTSVSNEIAKNDIPNVGGNVSSELSLSEVEANLKVLMFNSDSFFLVIMGIVVFLMQCGFSFLEAGAVRFNIRLLYFNLLQVCFTIII